MLYNSGSILNPLEMPSGICSTRSLRSPVRSRPFPSSRSIHASPLSSQTALRRILWAAPAKVGDPSDTWHRIVDDRIRNDVLRKGMPRTAIDRVFDDLRRLSVEFGPSRIGLDVNIVIGGPGTNHETAIDDAVSTARFALTKGAEHGIHVDLNLHPYYPGARGLARFPDHPRCSLATTVEVGTRIADLVRSVKAATAIFIGWNDEGHDTDRRERAMEIAKAGAAFDRFNQTNDSRFLDELKT